MHIRHICAYHAYSTYPAYPAYYAYRNIFVGGRTNVRPLQIPMALAYQAMFQAFVLTYGTVQRFDSSHTIWREEAVTTWDTML